MNPAPHPDARHLASARLLVLVAALFWSTSGFFAKANVFDGWPPAVLAFWRAFFALFLLVPLVRRLEWNWRIVPMTVAFAGMNLTYLSAMQVGTAANAIWLQCLAPTWVLLVGVFFLGEKTVRKDWVMLGFSLTGIGLILGCEMTLNGGNERRLEAVAWGVASGVLYAIVVLCLRALRGCDAGWLIALNHAVTAALFSLWMFGSEARSPHGIQWPLLIGFGMLQMGLPYVLFTRSLRTIPGHEASALALIEPVLVPLWTWLAWGERPAWWSLVGGGLIFVGLVVRFGGRFGVGEKTDEINTARAT